MVTAIGLPLLIVNDRFQSLGSMTVEDLETFIPFMVKCSVNRAGARVINGVPEWWSSIIKFKFPLKKPNWLSKAGYRKYLSAIVCSCYWYHDAQYLLPFCAKIASRPGSVTLQSNEDNTATIFNAPSTRPVSEFNNENKVFISTPELIINRLPDEKDEKYLKICFQNYDKKPKIKKPSRRSLLSTLPKKPSVIPDIYLCENCDAEFSSHTDMQKHETECYEIIDDAKNKHKVKSGSSFESEYICNKNQDDISGEIEVLEHIKRNIDPSVGKNNYFNYLMLKSKNSDSMQRPPQLKTGMPFLPCHRWVNVDFSFRKNRKVEFSSLFGRKILENSPKQELIHKIERNFMLNEYYCSTSFTNRSNREHKELVDFKVTCRKPKKRIWTHQYSFSKQQRRSRYMTLKTGLNEPSRRLLKQCKRLQVVLHRLNIAS